jgi:NADPH:quinone reductase-like Zn-dependent oxidoreductase
VKSTRYGGSVTCCGLVGATDLNFNVFPFILRGVSLIGIDSVQCPADTRLQVWSKLAGEWNCPHLEKLARECRLEDLDENIAAILAGNLRGRTVVKLSA